MNDNSEKTNIDNVLYANINGEKVKIDIPEDGALGLLAYGAIGLKSWRKVRIAAQNNRKKGEEKQTTEDND